MYCLENADEILASFEEPALLAA